MNKNPTTYRDPNNPALKISIVGHYSGIDVTTEFAVKRENGYFSAYYLDNGVSWKNCHGTKLFIKGFPTVTVNVAY